MPRSQDHVSSSRTSRGLRRRRLRIAAAGLTAVAALALTACGGQDNPLQTSAAKPFNPAPRTAEGPGAKGGEQPTPQGDGFAQGGTRPDGGVAEQASAGRGGTGNGGAGRSGNGAAVRHSACDAAAVRIVAQPLKEPINHLLLIATNTSGATCDLYFAPNLRFGQEQSPLAELTDSKPQSMVTLAPGESGYAGVLTSSADGSGHNGRTATGLSVGLPGRDGKGSIGGAVQVALPGGSVYVDDSAWVTYWQANPREATAW
ncbi:DUF4232 domain-containing protein [Streptomyces sp. NPDC050355]|uniref:DUF4232 domain-containing protein n=1 Tax=Streptomyces sp. NPDC050355 TaxID=3365609 RepID=UPI0037917969